MPLGIGTEMVRLVNLSVTTRTRIPVMAVAVMVVVTMVVAMVVAAVMRSCRPQMGAAVPGTVADSPAWVLGQGLAALVSDGAERLSWDTAVMVARQNMASVVNPGKHRIESIHRSREDSAGIVACGFGSKGNSIPNSLFIGIILLDSDKYPRS